MPTTAVRLIEYFDGRKQNMIPLFQRPYKWTKENWERLWTDIESSDSEKSPHFMGAVVSTPVTTVPIGVSKHLIIDGQQRLTTVAVILCALRAFLDERTRNRIQDLLINRHDVDGDFLKLLPTHADKWAYEAIVTGKPKAQLDSKIHDAMEFFTDKIKESASEEDGIAPLELLTRIENALKVVMINLDEKTDDPYEIFESLNATGTPLTPADLVRNFILMQFRHSMATGGDQEVVHEEIWKPIEANCGEELTQFLLHYCRMDGTEVRKKSIYKAFKSKLQSIAPDKLKAELYDIKAYSEIYPSFLRPGLERDEEIRRPLQVFKMLGVSVCYPVILRLLKTKTDRKDLELDVKKSLALIEAYLIRRAVCNLKNNALDGVFAKVLQHLPQEGMAASIHRSLSEGVRNLRWPNDEDFTDKFVRDAQYGRNATVHVLWSIEATYGHKEAIEDTGITMEHILPQTLDDEWKAELGVEEKDIERWKDVFGNLTLTGYNPELGNRSFTEKKKIYANSHFEITRQLESFDGWGIEAIETRGRAMAEIAVRLWDGPQETGG